MHPIVKSLLAFTLLITCAQAMLQNYVFKEDIANNITQLALKLNKLFYEPSKNANVLFSPINIYSALALIHLAANGTSRTEITELLGFPKDENLHQNSHEILSQILRTVENTTKLDVFDNEVGLKENEQVTDIQIADGIFVQKGMDLKTSYISQAESLYKGEVSNLDFVDDGSKARDTINQYISKNTKRRIEKVFFEPLTPDTRVILASVLYFRAMWYEPFSEFATFDADFSTGLGNVNVKMMSQSDSVPYINLPSLKAEAIKLMYYGNDVSMVILLPYVDQPLDNLVQSLSSDIIKEISQNSNFKYVNYTIPKMKCKWSDNIETHLQKLGVQHVFSNDADLSNMLTNTSLTVSEIAHVAEIEINEKGTEASAATVSKIVLLSMKYHPEPIYFTVNRPFVFYILHRTTNTILFLGSIKNPNGN